MTTDMSVGRRPHVLIVGGGFGGLTTARALKGAPVDVTLVDRCNYHLFQPLLYQVAMAGLSPADIAMPIRTVLRRQKSTQVLLAEVTEVDLDGRRVQLDAEEWRSYDYLVLAAGATTNFFGRSDWARNALGLKTIEDALEIRRRVLLAFEAAERAPDARARQRLLTFVVIGGGPTGVEVAGALAELCAFVLAHDFRAITARDTRVVLVEMQDHLLVGAFEADLGNSAQRQLEELGVEVRVSSPVERIDEQGVIVAGNRIEASTVLWTAGVRARTLGEWGGPSRDRSGRVIVEQDCSLPGHPEAFVIGDLASLTPPGQDRPLPGVAPVAMQQGRAVARNIVRSIEGESRRPFRYRDKGMMATVGRSRAVARTGNLQISGLLAWLAWLVIHIWYLVGFRNRVAVLLNWIWNYVTYRRGARLITGAGAVDELHELMGIAKSEPPHPTKPAPGVQSEAPGPRRPGKPTGPPAPSP